jgi:hypothetical protein
MVFSKAALLALLAGQALADLPSVTMKVSG